MVFLGLCIFVLLHFVICQELKIIPKLKRDEYNIPIIEDSIFSYTIPRLKCLGKELDRPYIEMISECFRDKDSIAYVKTKSKVYLSKGKAKEEQVEFLRCLGSMTIISNDSNHVRDTFYECIFTHNIEKYIEGYVKEKFRRQTRQDFKELLQCLAGTNDVNLKQEVTDCIQTNPVLIDIGLIFRNPFPILVIPQPVLKSEGKSIVRISSPIQTAVDFPASYYVDYGYYYR